MMLQTFTEGEYQEVYFELQTYSSAKTGRSPSR
jgi:hypothetical protein